MKIRITISLLLLLAAAGSVPAKALRPGSITVDGNRRSYWFSPTTVAHAPLVIVLHGGGGNGRQIHKHTGFAAAANSRGMNVVYPDGLNKGWIDGRVGTELPTGYDDVKFIRMMITALGREYDIDTNNIFATGISNGGFMSICLGGRMGDKISAIAPVTAGIPRNLYAQYKLTPGTSVLLINGTEDPLVPYRGGAVLPRNPGRRGYVVSTDSTFQRFAESLFCTEDAVKFNLADTDPQDGCKAARYEVRCPGVARAHLVVIEGGGHTWPGASQYLPVAIVGRVCRDFSATQMIVDFFDSVYRDKE